MRHNGSLATTMTMTTMTAMTMTLGDDVGRGADVTVCLPRTLNRTWLAPVVAHGRCRLWPLSVGFQGCLWMSTRAGGVRVAVAHAFKRAMLVSTWLRWTPFPLLHLLPSRFLSNSSFFLTLTWYPLKPCLATAGLSSSGQLSRGLNHISVISSACTSLRPFLSTLSSFSCISSRRLDPTYMIAEQRCSSSCNTIYLLPVLSACTPGGPPSCVLVYFPPFS